MSTKRIGARTVPRNFQELVGRIKKSERYEQEVLRSEISDQISCLMEAQNVSKAELARKLKKSRAYVTKILQGNANFTLDSLAQLADALGCKYVPFFVPADIWQKIQAVQVSARAKFDTASESDTYLPASQMQAEIE